MTEKTEMDFKCFKCFEDIRKVALCPDGTKHRLATGKYFVFVKLLNAHSHEYEWEARIPEREEPSLHPGQPQYLRVVDDSDGTAILIPWHQIEYARVRFE